MVWVFALAMGLDKTVETNFGYLEFPNIGIESCFFVWRKTL